MTQQLGRISGPLLEANLVRNGVPLSFRNYSSNPDLLYLDPSAKKITLSSIPGSQDLNVGSYPTDPKTTRTTNLIVDTQATLSNIILTTNLFETSVGAINITPNQADPLVTIDRMQVADLQLKDNVVSNYKTNGSIVLNPHNSGTVDIYSNTRVNGTLSVTGDMQIDGNLSGASQIIVGDSPLDTVTVATDFTQDIIPGDDLTWDLGKSNKRWRNIFSHQNLDVGTLTYNSFTIGDRLKVDGPNATISPLLPNDSVILNSVTGIIDIERVRFNADDITNLDEGALTLASTGIGYVRFMGVGGVVIPAGTTAEQSGFPGGTPEVGATRWNNDNPADQYLECYDGSVWNLATGAGGSISTVDNYDLSNAYILMLG